MTSKRYLAELFLCLVVYCVLLFFFIFLFTHQKLNGLWQPAAALLPMIPGCAFCWVVIREFRRIDELQRKIQFDALVFSFTGTALLTFSYGFLEIVGFPSLSLFVVWPVMALLWNIGIVWAKRHYQ
ncbi:MAG: hypothetical protein ACTIDN_11700 [Acetobacter sp.]|uniref:hypothetical protein n=1 Tax=Acetobacter sp. TaxID=440 RepID=UPI003F8F1ED8